MNKNFWYQFALAQIQSVGFALKAQDADNTGNDDMIGNLLNAVGTALSAFLRGDVKGFRGALKTIADSIYTFLEDTPSLS